MDEKLFDPEAEKYIISILFKYGKDGLIEVDEMINKNCFVDHFYRSCYVGLSHLIEEYPDIKLEVSSLVQILKEKRLVTELSLEDTKLLRAIMSMPVEISNVSRMATKLLKLHIARQMRENLRLGCDKIENVDGTETIGTILNIAESAVFDHNYVEQAGEQKITKMDEGVDEFIANLLDNPVDQLGYPIGLSLYEKLIGGGIRPGSVNVIMARPKTGKTFVVDHICLNAAINGIKVLNLDTEMMKGDHWTRLIAKVGELNLTDLECGKVDRQKALDATEKFKKLVSGNYSYKSVGGEENNDIVSIMRKWLVKEVGLNSEGKAKVPAIVVYDYLKLTDSSQITSNVAEHQAIGFVMTKLHDFMKRYGVGSVVFCQTNRDGISKEDASVASQSDRIVWLCTSLTLFKWKDQEDLIEEMRKPLESRYTHKGIVLFSRYGPSNDPGDFVNIKTNYAYGLLEEGPLNSELEPFDAEDDEDDEEDNDRTVNF